MIRIKRIGYKVDSDSKKTTRSDLDHRMIAAVIHSHFVALKMTAGTAATIGRVGTVTEKGLYDGVQSQVLNLVATFFPELEVEFEPESVSQSSPSDLAMLN